METDTEGYRHRRNDEKVRNEKKSKKNILEANKLGLWDEISIFGFPMLRKSESQNLFLDNIFNAFFSVCQCIEISLWAGCRYEVRVSLRQDKSYLMSEKSLNVIGSNTP